MAPAPYFYPAFKENSYLSGSFPAPATASQNRGHDLEAGDGHFDSFGLSSGVSDTLVPNRRSTTHLRNHGPAAKNEAHERVGEPLSLLSNSHGRGLSASPVTHLPRESAALEQSLDEATSEHTRISTTRLRHQHMGALIAIMHRLIMEGDFIRAGRAWGIILRAERGGHSFDLRTGGRWGIGADIHLQSSRPVGKSTSASGNQAAATQHVAQAIGGLFSPDGFAQARDYYERLVLQYPHRKAFPNTIGSLQFYPAMFGLWIQSIHDQRLLAEQALATLQPRSSGEDTTLYPLGSARGHGQQQIRTTTLAQADELAHRLDSVLSSPPYSDTKVFWNLKGMVALWIADLLTESVPSRPEKPPLKSFHEMTKEDWSCLEATAAGVDNHGTKDCTKSGKALLRARDAFERALHCGELTLSQH